MALTITEVLNIWNESGVFSYVLPFLLIFSVTFALILRSGTLAGRTGGENKPLIAIISASIGLLSLQFDFVSTFFAVIFPRFGIGLSILLVVLIFVGFLGVVGYDNRVRYRWVGLTLGIAVAIWAFVSWDDWFGGAWTLGGLYQEDFWSLAIVGLVVWLIYLATRDSSKPPYYETYGEHGGYGGPGGSGGGGKKP